MASLVAPYAYGSVLMRVYTRTCTATKLFTYDSTIQMAVLQIQRADTLVALPNQL